MIIGINEIKQEVHDGNSLFFLFHNKKCGLAPSVENGQFTYEIWCGERWTDHSSFDEAIQDKYFDGFSLVELLPSISITFV